MHTIYFNNSKALFWSLYHHLGPLLILFRIHMKISSERNPNTSWAVFCQSCTKVSNCKSGAFLLFLAIPRSTTNKHTWLQSLCSRTTCGRQKNKKLQRTVSRKKLISLSFRLPSITTSSLFLSPKYCFWSMAIRKQLIICLFFFFYSTEKEILFHRRQNLNSLAVLFSSQELQSCFSVGKLMRKL